MKLKDISFSNKFLITILVIYVFTSFRNFNLALTGLIKTSLVLANLIPVLLIVLLMMFLVNKYTKVSHVEKYLGANSGWKGWLYSIVFGILISGPPYLLFPLLKELKQKGMKDSLIAVFLYNRNVKIPFFPVMIYYFGLTFTLVLSSYVIVFSVLNGLLIAFLVDSEK